MEKNSSPFEQFKKKLNDMQPRVPTGVRKEAWRKFRFKLARRS